MSCPTRIRQLSHAQTRLLFCSILLLPPIHLGLRLLGYERLRGLAERITPLPRINGAPDEFVTIQDARELARIVSIAARRGFFKATCLRRSMLVWWLLRRHGFRSDIRFGVRTTGGQLEAHAWVEHDGIVLDDSEDVRDRYRALHDVLPPTTSGL